MYVDADFAGNWDCATADCDPSTARSCHGCIIRYEGCPILWASQLQTEIALSSTESKFMVLFKALLTTIPIIELLKELRKEGFKVRSITPQVKCRVFEDNSGAIEIATVPKICP